MPGAAADVRTEEIMETKYRARRLCILLSILIGTCTLNGCGSGGSGSAPPTAPPGSHTLEAVPYAQLGVGKIVFHRADLYGSGWRDGIYMVNPVIRSSSFEFDSGSGWYADGPQVSPDGLKVAYTRWTDSNTMFDVYVANLNGSGERQVSAFPGQEGPPAWTPDGQQILFYANTSNIALDVNFYRQPPAPGASQRVQVTNFQSTTSQCPSIASYTDRVSVAPSGQIVWDCAGNMEVTAPDGSTTTAIYTLPTAAPMFSELHASTWSPDGQRIAFLVLVRASLNAGPGERQQMLLKTVDPQGQNELVLATVASSGLQDLGGQNNIYSLCWAQDGSRIFFNVPDGNAQAHIWVVNADGSALTQVTNASMVWDHSVSCSR
jgi:Tol biopolymer transport system component